MLKGVSLRHPSRLLKNQTEIRSELHQMKEFTRSYSLIFVGKPPIRTFYINRTKPIHVSYLRELPGEIGRDQTPDIYVVRNGRNSHPSFVFYLYSLVVYDSRAFRDPESIVRFRNEEPPTLFPLSLLTMRQCIILT